MEFDNWDVAWIYALALYLAGIALTAAGTVSAMIYAVCL